MDPVYELRQYTLHPGRRDVLIDVFEREFVETQEAEGMSLPAMFRDLADPDRFVWLRSFPSMAARPGALSAFYTGPAWRAHRDVANGTMIDSDDVLLLRPIGPHAGFALDGLTRPPVGAALASASTVVAVLCYASTPVDAHLASFERDVLSRLAKPPLAAFGTLYEENNVPALPVRTGEHVLAWFSFEEPGELLAQLPSWVVRHEVLRLAPTARSLLR